MARLILWALLSGLWPSVGSIESKWYTFFRLPQQKAWN
jgi:hypothetical protein